MVDIGKISVIIPVYKVELYLEKCIQSVINQTYKNIEIVLVDDGSPDNCGSICDKYAMEDSRIKVIHKSNGGLSDARNAGMDVASGDYYFFLDSDDYIELNTFELLSSHIAKHGVEIAAALINCKSDCNDLHLMSGKEMINYIFVQKQFGWEACGKLIKSDLIKDKRFPVGRLYEDLFFIPHIILAAEKCSIIESQLYNYIIREDSIMGKSTSVIDADLVKAVENCLDLFRAELNEEEYTAVLCWSLDFFWSKYNSIKNNYKNNKPFLKELVIFMKKHKKEYIDKEVFKNQTKRLIKFYILIFKGMFI